MICIALWIDGYIALLSAGIPFVDESKFVLIANSIYLMIDILIDASNIHYAL
jgi:hypothetical protein